MADKLLKSIKFPTLPDRYVIGDESLSVSGAAADAKATGDEITNVKSNIDQIAKSFASVEPYLYKRGGYIHYSTGVFTELPGYSVYKIPVAELDVLGCVWSDTDFWGSLTANYGKIVEYADETFSTFLGPTPYGISSAGDHMFIIIGVSDVVNLYLNVKDEYRNTIRLSINSPYTRLSNDVITSKELNADNTLTSLCYMSGTKFGMFTLPYRNYYIKAKAGDIILFGKTIPGLSGYGTYMTADGVHHAITSSEFTAPVDCAVCLFDKIDVAGNFVYIPINSIKLAARDIIGDIRQIQFDGMDGVAFGTSLTYRSISSYGYLTTLESLSGVEFDNQGVGSSYIYGDGGQYDMLAKVKAYTGYSDKRVGILEGFVNDWYGNRTLGTWKDTTETSVCGCVRSALNYMLSQNANMTVFLVLDHYGRNYNIDCSSTAVNSSGLTQYEFYSEIAKVAESLGVPVIREFEDSGISENTPQYLADNIHCNQLGAVQSGYAIWYQMKQYQLNRA